MPFKDPERTRNYQRDYQSRYTKSNTARERKANATRASKRRQDEAALGLLGGRCKCIDPIGCAGSDLEVIEIDHIRGDGKLERSRRGGHRSGSRRGGRVMSDFRRHGLEYILNKYQLLCANCHRRKTKRCGDWKPAAECPTAQRPPVHLPLLEGGIVAESV